MADCGENILFQDQSIRFVDSDTSRAGNEPCGGISQARTLSGFDWKFNEADVLEQDVEEPPVQNPITELLASVREGDGMAHLRDFDNEATEARGWDRVYRRNAKPEASNSSSPSRRKRRDLREIICGGITNFLDEIIALLNGRSRDNEVDDVEYGPIRYVPHSLASLTRSTNFTKEELKTLYRTFKNECPTGVVYEDTLKSIYSQFFPSGDANMYAHYLFNAFDNNQEGYICFEDFVTSLSSLLRGKFEEKLQWVFKLYDINHDGLITKEEMQDIVKSVYSLLGTPGESASLTYSYMEHANRVFRKLDRNNDGYVTYPEFVDACSRDPSVVASMKIFEAQV